MHYQRLREQEMRQGSWEPGPCGNFGDPEGHRISARMGGVVRAEDREGLRAASRIGARSLAENNPEARALIATMGGQALSKNRERMSQMGKKGCEVRWGKQRGDQAPTESQN